MTKKVAVPDTEMITDSHKRSKRDISYASRVVWPLITTLIVLLGVHLLLQYLNLVIYDEKHGQVFELSNRFDFDDESSVPTWISQAIFLAVGVAALFISYLEKATINRRLWQIIGAAGIIVSVDEVIAMHEAILQGLHLLIFGESAPGLFGNAWLLVVPIILAAGFWMLFRMTRVFPRRTVGLFVVGAFVYVTGAVAIDMLTNSIPKNTYLSQGVLVALEEVLEMTGGLLFLYATIDYIEAHYSDVLRDAAKVLKRS